MNDLERIERQLSDEEFFEFDLSDEAFRQQALRRYMDVWPYKNPFYVRRLGLPAVLCTKAEHTVEVLNDSERFVMKSPGLPGYEVFDIFGGLESVLQMDGENHSRVRRLMNPAFSPVGLGKVRPAIEKIVDERLDRIETTGGIFDAMSDFCDHLILRALLDVTFQLNEKQIRAFERVHQAITLVPTFKPGAPRPAEYQQAISAVQDVIKSVIIERRNNHGTDFISKLITARDEGSKLSDAELHGQINTICGAALGSTAATLGAALFTLCRYPDAFDQLKADPGLAEEAVDECLRLQGPGLFSFPRFAAKDTEVGGTHIYRGMPVITSPQSASYDPALFDSPFDFRFGRKERVLTFGSGEHVCIGAGLARLTMRIGLTGLVSRFPRLRLANPDFVPVYSGNIGTMTLTTLPMRFD